MQLWGVQSSFSAHLCPNCRPKALGCYECWCRGLTLQGREEGVGSEGRGCPTSSGDGGTLCGLRQPQMVPVSGR